MIEKIVNIYMFKSEKGKNSYIYSLKKTNDDLGFDYHLLTKEEDNKPVICDATNAINILHSNRINLTPITNNTPEYKVFLTELLIAIDNKYSKEKVPNRK